jgi:hypothetical protein
MKSGRAVIFRMLLTKYEFRTNRRSYTYFTGNSKWIATRTVHILCPSLAKFVTQYHHAMLLGWCECFLKAGALTIPYYLQQWLKLVTMCTVETYDRPSNVKNAFLKPARLCILFTYYVDTVQHSKGLAVSHITLFWVGQFLASPPAISSRNLNSTFLCFLPNGNAGRFSSVCNSTKKAHL